MVYHKQPKPSTSILLFESLGVLWMVEQMIHVDASSKDAINLRAKYVLRTPEYNIRIPEP